MALITIGDVLTWVITRRVRTIVAALLGALVLRVVVAFVQELRAVPTFGTVD